MSESNAFPIPEAESQRTITFEVTFDFDKMYESVLDKHWGWMGDRPESFEEYCCMAVASQLTDHIRWNEYRTSQVLDVIKQHVGEIGRKRAEEAAARIDGNGDMDGILVRSDHGGIKYVTPEEYYRRRLVSELDSHAANHAAHLRAASEAAKE